MSLLLPFRDRRTAGGIVIPPDPEPPDNELSAPDYVGALRAQDYFGEPGGYDMDNFGPNSYSLAAMNTTHPPEGAYYGKNSGKIIVNPNGWLEGFYTKNPPDQPITVTCSKDPPHQHQVFRNGHYIVWNGVGNVGRMRGGVWRYKHRYPTKSIGIGHVPLIWPVNENWPEDGEFDITENFSGSVSWNRTESFIHYGDGTNANITWNSPDINIDMTQDHIISIAWHPGDDNAGTNSYLAVFADDQLAWAYKYNDTLSTSHGTKTGAQMTPRGTHATLMNLRLQVEAYGTSDSQYTGGYKTFRFYWFQAYAPLTLAQMTNLGYF